LKIGKAQKSIDMLKLIEPSDLTRYLTRTQWIVTNDDTFWIAKKIINCGEVTYVKFPCSKKWADYHSLILDAINDIAKFEGRNPSEIITSVTNKSPIDIVGMAINGEDTKDGTIDINRGLDLIESTVDLIKIAAKNVLDPKSHYISISDIQLNEFYNRLRMGQTNLGSYVVNIMVPLDLNNNIEGQSQLPLDINLENQIGRRCTTNLMRSLNYLYNNIENNDIKRIINPIKEDPIISSNLCSALYEMRPLDTDAELYVQIKWAEVELKNQSIIEPISFPNDHFDKIKYIADELTPREEKKIHSFTGTVYALHDYAKGNAPHSGYVYLFSTDEEAKRYFRIKVWLQGDMYQKAIKAHYDKNKVNLDGYYQRKGAQISEITKPTNFTLLE
jgi:hypothetical protein